MREENGTWGNGDSERATFEKKNPACSRWKWESDAFVTQFSFPYPGSPLTLFFQSQTQVLLGEGHTGAQ